MTDQTAAIEVWARVLCAADAHVHGYPTWQQLPTAPGSSGRSQDDYRKVAAWLLPRMTVADPAEQAPAADRASDGPGLRDEYLEAARGALRRHGQADHGEAAEFIADAMMDARDRAMEQLSRERDLAIAHDRQPYPTAWAYEQACKALRKHQERADTAEAVLARVRLLHDNLVASGELTSPDDPITREAAAERLARALDGWTAPPTAVLPAPADRAACPDPIECGHEAALGQAREETRRLGLMVDEYGAGASALTDKLRRARERHRETCILARGEVKPTAFRCGLCEVLDAPAASLRRMADEAQAEDPARIDRLRPEFFEHASAESIDVQIQRAQRQQRQWGNRVQTLTGLRETRVTQKELGEWPAVEAQQPKEARS